MTKFTTAVLFIVFSVASATAQTHGGKKLNPQEIEANKMAWRQINSLAETAPVPTTTSNGATIIVVNQEINGMGKTVSVLSNQEGRLFARTTDCDSGEIKQVLSGYSSSQYISSYGLFNTAKRMEAFPSMWSEPCLVEAYRQNGTIYERTSVDLTNLKTSKLSVINESQSSDGSYSIALSGALPKGSVIALGVTTLSVSISTDVFGNTVVTFPANTWLETTGPTTLTVRNPDGELSSLVYQRNIPITGNTCFSSTTGDTLPCGQ